MSYAERQIWIELITTAIVIGGFAMALHTRFAAGLFDGPDAFQIWAQTVLWMILAGIAVAIAVSILFAIAHAALTGERGSDLTDERDRLIAGFGWKITAVAMSAGFIAALLWLARGGGVLSTLNIMLAAFALGDVVGNLAKLWRYRADG